jgi:hypothetical protein
MDAQGNVTAELATADVRVSMDSKAPTTAIFD